MKYWLLKSEPSTFSIDDLIKAPRKTTAWDGVRNYQARNFLCAMKKNDLAFFYHSSCPQPAIVGMVKILREAYPDPTQYQPHSPYYDEKSTPAAPRWYAIDIQYQKKFEPLSLMELRTFSKLKNMILLKKGNRLSVTPVTLDEWHSILKLTKENT